MAKRKAAKPTGGTTGLVKRLRRQATETVSDVLDVMGLPNQVLASAIRALGPGPRLAGRAFCVRGRAIDEAHKAPPGVPYEVDRQLTQGCIVVMATGGWTRSAVIGGNVALSYRKKGCAGLVVDGAVRDAGEIHALGLATFATHITPRRPSARWSVVEYGQPVALPGQSGVEVIVHPEDLLLGDADGVVVIPAAIAAEVVAAAEKLEKLEKRIIADIKRGMDREAALKRTNRYGHIRKLVPG